MAQEGEASFAAGDVVLLQGTPDPHINGLEATLIRRAGTERWVVTVAGKDKSRILSTRFMQKLEGADTQSQSYCIVGSWDDWDAHPMRWDQLQKCFEFEAEIGAGGSESFKILIGDDWDHCIYPSHANASPFVKHTICGPDEGGLDECWTIGQHQEDKAAAGDVYKVRFFISSDGKPKLVNWVCIKEAQVVNQSLLQEPIAHVARRHQDATDASEVRGSSELQVPSSAKSPFRVDAPEGVAAVQAPVIEERRIRITGDKVVDSMHKRVDDALAMQAASRATDSARQTDEEGCFEVLHPRVAVRAGPSTSALNVAVAKLGQVIRGTPHVVDGQLWLMLDTGALRRLGATAYCDPGEQSARGWILMDGSHLGLGLLLRRTSKPEMPDEYGTYTTVQAKQKWEMMSYVKKQEPSHVSDGDPFGLASLDRKEIKAGVHPGKTNCMVCGFRATSSHEKIAHDRSTGHDGFWMCPT